MQTLATTLTAHVTEAAKMDMILKMTIPATPVLVFQNIPVSLVLLFIKGMTYKNAFFIFFRIQILHIHGKK